MHQPKQDAPVETIKLVATTLSSFQKLNTFRESLPTKARDQIDCIRSGIAGIEVVYKDPYGKTLYVPKNPLQLETETSDGEEFMRLRYDKLHVLIPRLVSDKPFQLYFVDLVEPPKSEIA